MLKRKFLIIRIGAIGDVIMTTPILKSIKNEYPHSHLTYVVGEWASEVLKHNPHIDELIVVAENIFLQKEKRQLFSLIRRLRKSRFDYGFALDKSWLFNLLLFLCNIRHRFGFSREHHLLNNILLTKQVLFFGKKKEYEYYSDILNISLGLKYDYNDIILYPNKKERDAVDNYMKRYKQKSKLVGIAPGGAVNPGQKALQKRWPKPYYKKLIDYLIKKGKKILIVGGKDDISSSILFETKHVLNSTGRLNLREVFYLLKKYCDTFVTHDSGPMHLAAAAKVKKLITLFGPTPAERFAPPNAIVIESPHPPSYTIFGGFAREEGGMKKISVEEVLKHI